MVLRGIGIFNAKKRKEAAEEEKYMLSNGAKLLQELIAACDGKTNPIRIFSAKELKKATDNYSSKLICYKDDCSVYYKGMLEDRIIIIRRTEVAHLNSSVDLKRHINEVVVLSQINHKNVVKLLGCCLEAQIPIIVYDYNFTYNKNLKDCIHGEVLSRRLSWEDCLRIANEVAEALVYVHLATPKTIVHMDIAPRNIWLDEHCNSKVTSFCHSESIPQGESHVQVDLSFDNNVEADTEGTLPYIDPEFIGSGRFTEKSDVYSFGVVLFELLSGIQASNLLTGASTTVNQTSATAEISYNSVMISHMKEFYVNKEGVTYQKTAFAELAVRCIQASSDERPTMKEACQELRRLRSSCSPPSTSRSP